MELNYYQVLGLSPDAELAVIKAAYRALCKKYHPDKFDGDPAEATARMQQVNEAHAVLSDPEKRREYDHQWGESNTYQDSWSEEQSQLDEELESTWQYSVNFYPDLLTLHLSLSRISKELAYAFKLLVVEEKLFNERVKLADQLETAFLTRYFGSNRRIQLAARGYIFQGRRQAALELNKAAKTFGNSIDADLVLTRVRQSYPCKAKNEQDADSKDAKTYAAGEEESLEQERVYVKRGVLALVGVLFMYFLAIVTANA
ncbi:J domain-containing protein [Ferrimonas gelatinilytica]|uniref:J domain-containing protein n=1 Tax=Ferrimonas gelatinilytica TaxID=1255257 RepID=A0ABP9S231_9GAMM